MISASGFSPEGFLTVTIKRHLPTDESTDGVWAFSPVAPDQEQPITLMLDFEATVVVGIFRSPDPAMRLRVAVGGRPAAIVALVPIDGTDFSGAAYAFSEFADFTVALVDADGAVVQEFEV